MEAKANTVTLTITPQKFLEKYPNTFQNIREIAQDAIKSDLDIRVEFLVIVMPEIYIPLSAMPTAKVVRS